MLQSMLKAWIPWGGISSMPSRMALDVAASAALRSPWGKICTNNDEDLNFEGLEKII